jgi:hypothetical protein
MHKWEYRIVYIEPVGVMKTTVWDTGLPEAKVVVPSRGLPGGKGPPAREARVLRELAAHLNKLGEEGWEVVGVTGTRYVLKRPKQ